MDPNKFARITESLRQYRRAELRDFEGEIGADAVNSLYVDPLPSEAVLNSVLSSNTTFLLGRKGTGKSTVFARAQNVLRDRQELISIYIDVKSLYDIINTSDVPNACGQAVDVDPGIYRTHFLRKAFLGAVLAEILKEIDKTSDEMSLWDKWTGKRKSYAELRENIDKLKIRVKEAALEGQELPILQQITKHWKSRIRKESSEKTSAKANISTRISIPDTVIDGAVHASKTDFDKSLDDNEI